MSPSKRIVLGIASFLPVILGFIFLICYFRAMMHFMAGINFAQNGQNPDAIMHSYFAALFPLFYFMIPLFIVSVILLIIYIVHAINNKQITDGERIVWIIVFLLAGSIGFPIYFFMRIYGNGDGNAVEKTSSIQ